MKIIKSSSFLIFSKTSPSEGRMRSEIFWSLPNMADVADVADVADEAVVADVADEAVVADVADDAVVA